MPDRIPEVTRVFANALQSGQLSDADRQYLGQLVSAKTGVAQAKQVVDDARKVSAALAMWLVVSLFVGAFVASLCATFGGRLRDSSVLTST